MSTVFIDVGATHTRMFVRDSTHGRRQGLASFRTNFNTLLGDLKKASKKLKIRGPLIIGMRGVWTPSEKKFWKKELSTLGKQLTILSDVELAHHFAFNGKPGILLNAGTGSIAIGRDRKGHFVRAGGLGPLFGDEGSGFWIGKEFIKSQVRKNKLIQWRDYLKAPDAITKTATLAPTVLTLVEYDPSRTEEARIVYEAQTHLLHLIEEVLTHLKGVKGAVPLHLWGGLFDNSFFRPAFLRRLAKSGLRVKPLPA